MRTRVVITMTVELIFCETEREPTREEVSAAVFELTEAALSEPRGRRFADQFRMSEATFSHMVLRDDTP